MGWLSWLRGKDLEKRKSYQTRMDGSFTRRLQSQEQEFHWLEGRRLMSDVPYLLPNDLQEVSRLDFQHYMLRSAIKGNYLVPIREPRNILDVGCGTGRWMQEVATVFPQATIVGIDIVLPSTEAGGLATMKNCNFKQGNILEGLPFKDMSFDFVHQRLLVTALPAENWPFVVNELVRVTYPGGWVELVEADPILENIGPVTRQLLTWGIEACRLGGIDLLQAQHLETRLKSAGLLKVMHHTVHVPVGNWGGRLGSMALTDIQAVFKALRPLILSQLKISAGEYDRANELALREYEMHQTIFNFHFAYGQRQG